MVVYAEDVSGELSGLLPFFRRIARIFSASPVRFSSTFMRLSADDILASRVFPSCFYRYSTAWNIPDTQLVDSRAERTRAMRGK
jgi:hypothetical protein